jgi:hypothetical protein
MTSTYLLRQADALINLSRATFDLTVAGRFAEVGQVRLPLRSILFVKTYSPSRPTGWLAPAHDALVSRPSARHGMRMGTAPRPRAPSRDSGPRDPLPPPPSLQNPVLGLRFV